MKNHQCVKYKSCDNVPCGQSMNKCKPSYCVPGSSRNWTHCNMSNWGGPQSHRRRQKCRDESKCRTSKRSAKTRDTVDAQTLHQKMPYIWRFLKPHTRRHMIELAKKPVKEINIPGHVFPDSPNKFQTKKLSQRYKHLRKTYRKI